jgi:shikimate dehydrogenase
VVANRTVERAERLATELRGTLQTSELDDRLLPHLAAASLLINATALGWQGARLPIAESALQTLPSTALVYDLTYRETPFLRAATQLGYDTLDGLEMLVAQGAESFRLWTGQEPPHDIMLAAARKAAAARS